MYFILKYTVHEAVIKNSVFLQYKKMAQECTPEVMSRINYHSATFLREKVSYRLL